MHLEESSKGHQKTREQLLLKLKEQRQKERINKHGIDEDSVISVRVVEARDLTPMDITGKSDPYVVLKFGN